ncbi:MAG: HEAT repeat domain-containing protein [Planctomycetota bacterium]|jgi:HEAT repeat protein
MKNAACAAAVLFALLAACQVHPSKKHKMSVAELLEELKSADVETRISAARELGTRRGPDAKKATEQLEAVVDNDPDPAVRSMAAESIAKIREGDE